MSTAIISTGGVLDRVWGTKEYIRAIVAADEDGTVVDPTGDTVDVAFTEDDADPQAGDWVSGSWETIVRGNRTTYKARALVDSSATQAAGVVYTMFVRVHDSPETPVLRVGYVRWV